MYLFSLLAYFSAHRENSMPLALAGCMAGWAALARQPVQCAINSKHSSLLVTIKDGSI